MQEAVTIMSASKIAGNASAEVKEFLQHSLAAQCAGAGSSEKRYFADTVFHKLEIAEVSILDKGESESRKKEARVVCKIKVAQDMLNGGGAIHGGCSATLIALCSTLSLMAYKMSLLDGKGAAGVSQSLNVVYHSPASFNDELRIVNTTMTVGARAQSARTEIWNVTHHRLIASGVQVKMTPSPAPAKL